MQPQWHDDGAGNVVLKATVALAGMNNVMLNPMMFWDKRATIDIHKARYKPTR